MSQENLQQILENVTTANGYRYQVKDNLGSQTDAIKIIQNPSSSGPRYIGVHHIYQDVIVLTGSPDLLNWTRIVQLDTQSSMPYIFATSDNGFIVASEKYIYPNGHLKIRYYSNYNNLITANPAKVLDVTGNITGIPDFNNNGGTPNIYYVTLNPDIDHSVMDIGFHFNTWGTQYYIDLNGRGQLTNFISFAGSVQTDLNNAIIGIGENDIGGRDSFKYNNHNYIIIEGNPLLNGQTDWYNWHLDLYDQDTKTATRLNIKTHGGSKSIAKPTFTRLILPNGKPGMVMTYFIPGEGAASGEGGPLIFYKEDATISSTTCKDPMNLGCTLGIPNTYIAMSGLVLILLVKR